MFPSQTCIVTRLFILSLHLLDLLMLWLIGVYVFSYICAVLTSVHFNVLLIFFFFFFFNYVVVANILLNLCLLVVHSDMTSHLRPAL